MDGETPKLAKLLETFQEEAEERLAAEADSRRLAAAMLGRLISAGVDDLRQARRAGLAFAVMLDELERIEHRERGR
jgi:hypothetical protein